MSNIDINKVAKLANLPLTKEELDLFTPQLERIVSFVEKLNEVDTSSVEPTFQVTGKTNALREDIEGDAFDSNTSTKNASRSKNGYILTNQVIKKS